MVRLRGGYNPQGEGSFAEGTVEVLHEGVWGSICGLRWDERDAKVVCNMLGYT